MGACEVQKRGGEKAINRKGGKEGRPISIIIAWKRRRKYYFLVWKEKRKEALQFEVSIIKNRRAKENPPVGEREEKGSVPIEGILSNLLYEKKRRGKFVFRGSRSCLVE